MIYPINICDINCAKCLLTFLNISQYVFTTKDDLFCPSQTAEFWSAVFPLNPSAAAGWLTAELMFVLIFWQEQRRVGCRCDSQSVGYRPPPTTFQPPDSERWENIPLTPSPSPVWPPQSVEENAEKMFCVVIIVTSSALRTAQQLARAILVISSVMGVTFYQWGNRAEN